MGNSAVLYQGTGCDKGFMKLVARSLRKFSFNPIKTVCWHKRDKKGILDDIADYPRPKNWNVQKGNFDLVVGHSAGGFPVVLTKGTLKIAFNPFLSQYPLLDVVFHAKDDWLVPPNLFGAKNVIGYLGRHGTFPEKEFESWLETMFPRTKKQSQRGKRTR